MRNLFHSLPLLTALNLALAASLFVIGTAADFSVSVPAWALACMILLAAAGLVVTALAVWRLLDRKVPAMIPAMLLNGPAGVLHVMALSTVARLLFA
jgi:hypothetical protein